MREKRVLLWCMVGYWASEWIFGLEVGRCDYFFAARLALAGWFGSLRGKGRLAWLVSQKARGGVAKQ